MRQGGDYVAFDRYGVLTDLAVEGFAEKDNVVESLGACWLRLFIAVKPELHLVEEMKASRIHQTLLCQRIIGSEENRGGEDALKSRSDSPVLSAVLGETEVVE